MTSILEKQTCSPIYHLVHRQNSLRLPQNSDLRLDLLLFETAIFGQNITLG